MSPSSRAATRTDWPTPSRFEFIGPHQGNEPIEVTLVMRRRGAAPTPAAWPHPPALRREEFGANCGAGPADVESARRFARDHELEETGCEPHRRILRLRGSAQALQDAFGVQLGSFRHPGTGASFVGCDRAPTLPAGVIAVLGLDRRPVAKAHYRKPKTQPEMTYTPPQLGQLYSYPAQTDGSGQCVAVIELGGGYSASDLAAYCAELGIEPTPAVAVVSVAGGESTTGGDADAEVMLDVEVIGTLAPAAKIAAYFAPNTDQGFYEAISQAAHDTANQPSVISISWGGPEDSWSTQSLAAMQSALEDAAALGVTVTAAAGDDGSSDGESDGLPHVDFPASSPYALACGGTRLVASAGTISSEVVWNEAASNEGATGGGVSADYPLPTWQDNAGVPATSSGHVGRGVPDVSGNADPLSGYQVRVDGADQVIGGTSAVAPLWAALVARCNQQLGAPLGDMHTAIYQIGTSAFSDITQGNNGDYEAGEGWDPCTGLGSPSGQALLDALATLKGGASGE